MNSDLMKLQENVAEVAQALVHALGRIEKLEARVGELESASDMRMTVGELKGLSQAQRHTYNGGGD